MRPGRAPLTWARSEDSIRSMLGSRLARRQAQRRRRRRLGLAATAVGLPAALLLLSLATLPPFSAGRHGATHAGAPASPASSDAASPVLAGFPAPATEKRAPAPPTRFLLVRVPVPLPITRRPGGGDRIGLLPSRTRFGNSMVAWVITTRDGRYGRVSVPWSAGHSLGWISLHGLERMRTRISLVVDRSSHVLRVKRGDKIIHRFKVATGRPESPTPLGRFFVTDRLVMGPAYGGFAFAVSTIQVLPSSGLATGIVGIHGTSNPASIGTSVSHGCIRVSAWALDVLKRLVAPGTPVLIEA
jgi:hypothetical protein